MFPKTIRPGATLDWEFDWGGELPGPWLSTGETIDSHTTATTGPVSVNSSAESSGKVTVWLAVDADAAVGSVATLVCSITTSVGRTDQRQFDLKVGT